MILVMQRLHEADLAGQLLEAGGWGHLNLPAIAEADEEIPIGNGLVHVRRAGDLLHPEREPRDILEALQRSMGSAAFSAQYQQAPVPPSGLMVKVGWLQRFGHRPEPKPGDRIVQSWDCASKDGVMNDWSVCITALVRRRLVHILEVYRARLQFPDLYRQAVERARHHKASAILIEDAASGTQLLQQLRANEPRGVIRPIACKPHGDKVTRMAGASNRIEAGELLLPEEAPWLAEFERELLAFPNGRNDDQADALSQLLNWDASRLQAPLLAAPKIIYGW